MNVTKNVVKVKVNGTEVQGNNRNNVAIGSGVSKLSYHVLRLMC